MDTWMKGLFEKNRIAFWIVLIVGLPVVLLFVFKDLILKLIVSKANVELQDAKVSDARLEEKQLSSQHEADLHKAEADQIENKISNLSGDEDWNKKRKGEGELLMLSIIFGVAMVWFAIESFL